MVINEEAKVGKFILSMLASLSSANNPAAFSSLSVLYSTGNSLAEVNNEDANPLILILFSTRTCPTVHKREGVQIFLNVLLDVLVFQKTNLIVLCDGIIISFDRNHIEFAPNHFRTPKMQIKSFRESPFIQSIKVFRNTT